MQFRHYLAILRRAWLLLFILPAAVAALSTAVELARPQRYGATTLLMVSQTPREANGDFADINLNYSWTSSEFILDDLPQVVASAAFAQDVAAMLAERGSTIAPEQIRGTLSAEIFHRSVTLATNAATPEIAVATLEGATAALQRYGLKYWDRSPGTEAGLRVVVLTPPEGAAPLNGPRRLLLNVGLRTALALAAAIGLALLFYYLDTTVRDARQAEEATGLRLVGIIPRE